MADSISSTQSSLPGRFPCIAGDIGGTNARFAVETAPGVFSAAAALPVSAFGGFEEALDAYLAMPEAREAGAAHARALAVAIANPVDSDAVKMTNSDWRFSVSGVRKAFGLDAFMLVNDYTALAMALPLLKKESLRQWGGKTPPETGTMGLIGPGTGLGVSGAVYAGGVWVPLETEGGHVSLSPSDELEMALLAEAKKDYAHVSAERLLSGGGLEYLFRLLAKIKGKMPEPLRAWEITSRALAESDPLCSLAVETFCRMLGTAAGNLALTLGAKCGIFIGGGIVLHLKELFFRSGFRQRFEAKGRFESWLKPVPVFVIRDHFAALPGVSALMDRFIAGPRNGSRPAF